MNHPPVAIVVLTYDGFELVREALLSIGSLDYPRRDVIVVDNGSSDTTAREVRRRFPNVELLTCEVNLGLAGGFNAGLRRVLKGDWKYALLMHNDVEPEPSMLREMVAGAESAPACAAVGPKIHLFWDRERLLSAGGSVGRGIYPVRWRGYDEVDRGQFDVDTEVDCVGTAAMLVNLEVVRKVGLLDPQLRHLEDADWCLRARQAGHPSLYCHRAAAWRMAVRTAPDRPRRARDAGRSASFFVRRHAALPSRGFFFAAQAGSLLPALLERAFLGRRSPLARARGALSAIATRLAPPPQAR